MGDNRFTRRSFLALTTGALAAAKAVAEAKPVDNQEPLKKILLLGDSAKAGYQKKVESLIAAKATIISPSENTGNSVNVLGQMEKWLKQYEPDVVLISTGFEDCRTIYYGSYENLVPEKFYVRNVKAILQATFIFPVKSTIAVWATSTYVNDDRQVTAKAKERDYSIFNDDVLLFNDRATRQCKKLKVPIIDLYNVMANSSPDTCVEADGFRLTAKGNDVVARAIATQLDNFL